MTIRTGARYVRNVEAIEFRHSSESDLDVLYQIRYSVTENRLINMVIPREEVVRRCGEGGAWICLDNGKAVAFSIASMQPEPILWALFVRPSYEGRGIGQQLMAYSLDWFKAQGATVVSLSTDPGTRADRFYQAQGWKRGGLNEAGEVVFTLDLRSTPGARDLRYPH